MTRRRPVRLSGPIGTVDTPWLRFPGPGGVYVAGFDIACPINPGPLSIAVYDNGDLGGGFLGSTMVDCQAFPGAFVGVTSTAPIGVILVVYDSAAARVELLDNLVFGPRQDDLVLDFGAGFGTWGLFDYGSTAPLSDSAVTSPSSRAYAQLHVSSPEEIATGDIDGNGRMDAILDFPGFGVWAWMNDTSYVQLHTMNVAALTTGDLDGNGQDDVVLDFPGFGLWLWFNNTMFVPLHSLSPTHMATGDLTASGKDCSARRGACVWPAARVRARRRSRPVISTVTDGRTRFSISPGSASGPG